MIWTSLNLSDWQLALSPVLLFVSWRFFRVPALAVLLSCLLVLLLANQARSYSVSSEGGFLLARFHSDPNEYVSYQFRVEINQRINSTRNLRWNSEKLTRYPKPIYSEQEAQKLLESDQSVNLVVWDRLNAALAKRWIWLSFPSRAHTTLGAVASGHLPAELLSLQIVESFPASGLSFEPAGESATFLGLLIRGLAGVAKGIPGTKHEEALLALKQAMQLEALWTSYAHRTVAGFFLGNAHLKAAFAAQQTAIGELDCASSAYRQALGSIRDGDNPELEAAVYNNLGVALYLRAYLLSQNSEAKQATKAWRNAVKTLGQANPFSKPFIAARIAKANFQLARSLRGPASIKQFE